MPRPPDLVAAEEPASPRGGVPPPDWGAGRPARGGRPAHPPHALSSDLRDDGRGKGRMAARAWVQGPRADPASAEARPRDPWAHPQRHSAGSVASVPQPPGRFRGDEVLRADPQRRLSGPSFDRTALLVLRPP